MCVIDLADYRQRLLDADDLKTATARPITLPTARTGAEKPCRSSSASSCYRWHLSRLVRTTEEAKRKAGRRSKIPRRPIHQPRSLT
jgi:hypothetical protein